MTHEEMAAELRSAGWRIQEPLTQKNCRHPRMQGSCGMGADGSGFSESFCPDCGWTSKWSIPARDKPSTFSFKTWAEG